MYIEGLTAKVAADAKKIENRAKRSKTGAAVPMRASPMKEDETRRLIYARKVIEFEKCIDSALSKWDLVAEIFNKGFVAKRNMLAGVV